MKEIALQYAGSDLLVLLCLDTSYVVNTSDFPVLRAQDLLTAIHTVGA